MHILFHDTFIIGYILSEKLQDAQDKLEKEKINLYNKTIDEINKVKNIFISNIPENPLYVKSHQEINDLYKILKSLEDKEAKQKIAILIDEYKKITGYTSKSSDYESSNVVGQRFNYFLKVNGEIRKNKLEYTVHLFYLFGEIYRIYYSHNQFDNSLRKLCRNERSVYYNDNRVFFESIIKHFDINYWGVNNYVKNNFKYQLVKINEVKLEDIKYK